MTRSLFDSPVSARRSSWRLQRAPCPCRRDADGALLEARCLRTSPLWCVSTRMGVLAAGDVLQPNHGALVRGDFSAGLPVPYTNLPVADSLVKLERDERDRC